MISEESCDTEDCHLGQNKILKIENLNNMSLYFRSNKRSLGEGNVSSIICGDNNQPDFNRNALQIDN